MRQTPPTHAHWVCRPIMPKAAAGAQPAGGRPSTAEFNKLEDLAVARAALAACVKPNLPSAELTKRAAELYPLKLAEVTGTYQWVDKKYGRAHEMWTMVKSSSLRPQGYSLWERWQKRLLPACRNVLSPALAKWYNADGTPPSGQTLEDAEEFVLDAWYKHKMGEEVAVDLDGTAAQVDALVLAKRLIRGGNVVTFPSISINNEELHDMVKTLFKTPGKESDSQSLTPDMFTWTQPDTVDKMLTEKSNPEKMAKLAFTFHSVGDLASDDQKESFIYKICQRCQLLVSAAVDHEQAQADEQDRGGPDEGDVPAVPVGAMPAAGPEEGGVGKKRPKRPKPKSSSRPSDWDPGNIYFLWKALGPLGENVPVMRIPGPKPKPGPEGEKPSVPPPPNRQQQKDKAEQDRQDKRNEERGAKRDSKQAAIDDLILCQREAIENDNFTIELTQWEQQRIALSDEYGFAKDMGDPTEMQRVRELARAHNAARPTRTRPAPEAGAPAAQAATTPE